MMTAGRNWYQLLLMVLTVFWVLTAWLSGSAGQAITASFPTWSQNLWYGGLTLGALVTAAGIIVGAFTGLLVEKAGLFTLIGICVGYDVAFLAFADRASLVHVVLVVALIALYAVVNFARVRQIDREIGALRHGLRRLAAPEAT